jgi:hypothetical protein
MRRRFNKWISSQHDIPQILLKLIILCYLRYMIVTLGTFNVPALRAIAQSQPHTELIFGLCGVVARKSRSDGAVRQNPAFLLPQNSNCTATLLSCLILNPAQISAIMVLDL